jgi:hypothetical protein
MGSRNSLAVCALAGGTFILPAVFAVECLADEAKGMEPPRILLHGKVEKKGKYKSLEGTLSNDGASEDEDKELSIEWDRWRNKFAKAIWKKTNQKLAGGDAWVFGKFYIKYGLNPIPHFDKGVRAEVSCDITSEGRVCNVNVVTSSGVEKFTQLVVDSFHDLSYKSFLDFPKGSQREKVSMTIEMKMGNGEFHEHKFDDVEKVRFNTASSAF